jgi:type II secretory pathway pseudopilin PulG
MMQLGQQFRRRAIGFSLVELLVIIAILGILAAAGIPAIRNMIYTSTGSMAETQLKFALGAARDLAIRSASGDTAAVFTFEPGGRLTVVPMVYVGRILDTKDPEKSLSDPTVQSGYRDVFAPSALAEPMQLPAGWMVRGFAPAGSIFADGPNNESILVNSNGWYYSQPASAAGNRRVNITTDPIANGQSSRGNWVFPETAFFDPDVTERGTGPRPNSRSTFMVRFQTGTGRIMGASPTPAIVLLPRGRIDTTNSQALANVQSPVWAGSGDWRRIDHADNLVSWGRSVCNLVPPVDAAALIGCRSTDAVLAASVNIIALYDESKMANAIGARGLNKVTGSIYGGAVSSGTVNSTANEIPKAPNIDLSLWPTGTFVASGGGPLVQAERVQILINNYMLNALRLVDVAPGSAPTTARIDSDARLFTVDTYLGSVSEAK